MVGLSGRVWAIVLAGGSGRRFRDDGTAGSGSTPAKQFLTIAGRSLLAHSVTTAAQVTDGVTVVLPDLEVGWDTPELPDTPLHTVAGGAERADSVRAGLTGVPRDVEMVVVADAAHPLASAALFRAVIGAVRDGADGAVPGLPLVEALARMGDDGTRTAGVARTGLVSVQMPHAFRAAALRAAHAGAPAAVEDSELVANAGGRVVVVPGEPSNLHVTTPADLALARRLVEGG